MSTDIQWTDETWNPVTGCTKVSPGCAHCYAEGVAERFWAVQYPPVDYQTYSPDNCCYVTEARARVFTDVQTHADRLTQPLRWRKPRRVFVNSMSDLFHEDVPDLFIEQVFSVMGLAERHTFQVLTKRADRMLAWFRARRFDVKDAAILQTENAGECHYALPWPLPNVWLGVSVENQHFADERIPLLLQTPAAVRFISAEPLLGSVNLQLEWLSPFKDRDASLVRTPRLDWVIVGGESGHGARPFDIQWGRNLVEQCRSESVPVFVKQLGGNPQQRVMYGPATFESDQPVHVEPLRLRSHKGGDMSEWPTDLRVREFPARGSAIQ